MIEFSRVIELPRPPAEVRETLWDLHRIERCIPGCEGAQEVEPRQRYRVTVRDRVGPYRVEIPLDVAVDPLESGSRVAVKASGRDSVLSSTVRVSMIVALAQAGAGTSLTLQGRIEAGGKLAALGQGVMTRKTLDMLGAFAANLDQLLKEQGGTAAV